MNISLSWKRLILQVSNIIYLRKIDLRKILIKEIPSYEDLLESLLYFCPDASISRPDILTLNETLNALITTKKV